jgi:hypothetical protein
VSLSAQPCRQPIRVTGGQGVDDAATGELAQVLGQPGHPCRAVAETQRMEREARTHQGATLEFHILSELSAHVRDDAVAGRGGGGEYRDVGGQDLQDATDATVGGPEVVSPFRDAVGLVDDQHAHALGDGAQAVGQELIVGQALQGNDQQVERITHEATADRRPVILVGGVQRGGPHAHARGRFGLVAHERQQRRDDERGSAPGSSCSCAMPMSSGGTGLCLLLLVRDLLVLRQDRVRQVSEVRESGQLMNRVV